jgi:hypothetical protein
VPLVDIVVAVLQLAIHVFLSSAIPCYGLAVICSGLAGR